MNRPISFLPAQYRGVWQRTSIERPTGKLEDNTSKVFWIQTSYLFTDIRIPKRPEILDQQLSSILKQRASAGFTEIEESSGEFSSILKWNCELDYHPDCGTADIGGCYFLTLEKAIQEGSRTSGDLSPNRVLPAGPHPITPPEAPLLLYYQDFPTMIEKGLPPQDYREVWVKRDPGSQQSAFILQEETPSVSGRQRKGIWLISGDYWSCTLDRYKGPETLGSRITETRADSLGELLREWKLPEADQYKIAVEFEGYFGKIEKREDGKKVFMVYHSTRPEMEGKIWLEMEGNQEKKPISRDPKNEKESLWIVNHWGYERKWSIVTLDHNDLF